MISMKSACLMRGPRRLKPGLLALSLLVSGGLFYGCDALLETPDTIVLQPKEATFRFEFDAGSVTTGNPVTLQSVGSFDFSGALSADGYTKGEVVAANISSVALRRTSPSPLNFRLSGLSDVRVQLRATDVASIVVASRENLPEDTSASLSIVNRSVETFVRAPSFRAVIEFVPLQLDPSERYFLEVVLDVRIEVQG